MLYKENGSQVTVGKRKEKSKFIFLLGSEVEQELYYL